MMQKEVADRILAAPGSKDYDLAPVQFDCTAERVIDIPPTAFIPRPQVTSTVLKIRRRERPAVEVKDRKASSSASSRWASGNTIKSSPMP